MLSSRVSYLEYGTFVSGPNASREDHQLLFQYCSVAVTVTEVFEMPEEKTPDETVARSDEKYRQDPRAVSHVQEHA